MANSSLTVKALAEIISDWPQFEDDGTSSLVLAGPSYPDCSLGLEPIVSAGSHKKSLCLFPAVREIPMGSLATNASALELAMAALRYQLSTPPMQYDPEVASGLFLRAIVAIEQTMKLERGLAQ